jgi:hypothetical protein
MVFVEATFGLQYQAGLAALKLIDVHLAARDLFDFQAR